MNGKLRITFLTTRYDLMKSHWKKNTILKEKGIVGTNKPIGRDIDLGGILIDLDWETFSIENELRLSCPAKFETHDDVLIISSMRMNRIDFYDKDFLLINSLHNKLFNDLHWVDYTTSGSLIVTSTGLDAIIEIDMYGKELWSWYAVKNGFQDDQFGNMRIIDKTIDHTQIDYPTLSQTTHVNSAIEHPDDPGKILTCLFHQGIVAEIDKKNGSVTPLLTGLKNPHALRITNKGVMVCNTRCGEILYFDINTGKITKRISIPTNWLQDAIEGPNDSFYALRGDKNDIVQTNQDGNILKTYTYSKKWRAYSLGFQK